MKYIGIDFGSKRIGVAVSDEMGKFSFPKKVFVGGKNSTEEIAQFAKEFGAGAIVVGESRDYAGNTNPIQEKIMAFKKELEIASGLPVHLELEFMTSMQASRLNHELSGNKDMLDASAAAFILQSFLDKQNG